MKNSLTSLTLAVRQNRMVHSSLVKRTAAAGSRVLPPTPAAGEVLLVGLVMLQGSFLIVWQLLSLRRTRRQPDVTRAN